MKTKIRLGLVQFEARSFGTAKHFFSVVEAHIRALAAQKVDFVLFPEYFTLSLGVLFAPATDRMLLEQTAAISPELCTALEKWAQTYQTNVIAGSMPVMDEGALYNRCYLMHRDGRVDFYDKTHLTPFERGWNVAAGAVLKVWQSDCGPIAPLICYDCEFPEAARKVAQMGAKILFVPFQTETRQGNNRVSVCARARAVENECYVACAGMVGAFPECPLAEYNYAESAVYAPSDTGFPLEGIVEKASANVPAAFFCELDLALLDWVHREGSVRTVTDRRLDLY